MNHGGKTNGFTVPNQVAQSNVDRQRAAPRRLGPARQIDYVEAHGTGTSLGDPIEIAGLSKAFAVAVPQGAAVEPASCRIGSVKSNVGHLESAAGIAGLTKVLLQMRHGRIAPSLHSATPNPNIDFARTPVRVVREAEEWTGRAGAPRRAAISAFGAGGSNAHLVIEEHVACGRAGRRARARRLRAVGRQGRAARALRRARPRLPRRAGGGRPPRSTCARSRGRRRSAATRWTSGWRSSRRASPTSPTRSPPYRDGSAGANVHRGSVRKHGARLDAILDVAEQDALVAAMVRGGTPAAAREGLGLVRRRRLGRARRARKLYGARPQRMSFPTMPFLTKRYWIDERKAASATAAAALHPLIDANVSTLSQQAYAKTFDGNEFYLRDHVVEAGAKRIILPGTAYLEMARAAGALAVGTGWTINRIRNLLWIQPVEIDGGSQSVRVELRQDDDRVEFEIVREGGEVCVEGELGVVPAADAPVDEHVDLDALRATALDRSEHAALYDRYRALGFHYGPSFRVTQEVLRLPGAALGRMVLPDALRAGAGAFALHPCLLDGVLRTCIALTGDAAGAGPIVPFALGELEIRHPVIGECWALATETAESAHDGTGLRKYDIVVADAGSRVLATLKDFAARLLNRSRPTRRSTSAMRGSRRRPLHAAPAAGAVLLAVGTDAAHDARSLASPDARLRRFCPCVVLCRA